MVRNLAGWVALMICIGSGSAGAYKVENVSTGHTFTEGPVWTSRGTLLFSDIPGNKIWEVGDETTVFRTPSGNSNGLTFDREGRLIACEHSNRRVSRTESDGTITVLADRFEGKRLNSPNDAVVKSDGSIYFTDPPYGISHEQQELDFQGVYRIDPEGKLELLVKDFVRPNGLCFSPDEKLLYIADSSNLRHVRVFNVAEDGTLSGGEVFARITSDKGVPDGMKVDPGGRLYVAGPGGVWIFDTDGKHVETIETPETPANLAWGGRDGKTLYVTAVTSVYKVRPGKAMLSCDTYSLRDYFSQGKLDYLTVPAALKEMGIRGIAYNDIWMKSYDTAYLDSIKKACADAGVKITGLICDGNLATPSDAAWNAQIEENRKKMRAAAYLGAAIVRLDLGGLGDEEKDDTIGAQRCIDAFKKLLPLAKELNLKMTIENHGGVSKKADTILKVIKGSDPAWVGSCPDFGNWPDEVRYTETAKLASYAYHVHAKTHRFNEQGEDANKDYKRLLQMLRDADYTYAVSIEYEGSEDQMLGVKKTRDLILKHWPQLGE